MWIHKFSVLQVICDLYNFMDMFECPDAKKINKMIYSDNMIGEGGRRGREDIYIKA